MYITPGEAPGIAICGGKATTVALNSRSFGSDQNFPGALTDYPPTLSADTVVVGWGLCRQWPADWCHGYKGSGNQACQDCGHGFEMHY